MRGRLPELICGGASAVSALLAQIMSRPGSFHPSLLLNVADTDQIAGYVKDLDPDFQFTTAYDHYDGVYLWTMAHDPLALGQAHDLIDLAAYRYGHPLYSWLAGALSLGQPQALPWVFWLLSVVSMAAAAVGVSLLARRLGASAWLGLLVAASPGLLFSASTALTEPAQLALTSALLILWLRPRTSPFGLAALSVVLCLTKEQLILVPLTLGLHQLIDAVRRNRRPWRPGFPWGRLLALAAGPLALGAWLYYVRGRFTAEQLAYDSGNVGWPISGWLETFSYAAQLRHGDAMSSQVGSTAVPGLLAVAVIVLAGAVIGLLRRDELGLVVLAQAILISTLGWRTLLFPHEMFRIPAMTLLLAMLLIVVQLSRPDAGQSPPVSQGGGLAEVPLSK